MNVLGITKYFDDILISSDYHTKKPDKRFFHILLERHKLDVSHSCISGMTAVVMSVVQKVSECLCFM